MRKYIYILCLAMTACTNDVSESDTSAALLFEANIGRSATRAGVAVQSTYFDSGQKVDVFISENGGNTVNYEQPLTYSASPSVDAEGFYALADPQHNSTAIGEVVWPNDNLHHTIDINAYYPSGIVTNLSAANSFTVQSDQSSTGNYRQSDLMAAQLTGVSRQKTRVKLTFTHLLTKVIVTLKGDRSLNINHEGWRDGATEEQRQTAQVEANSKLIGATVRLLTVQPTLTITKPRTLSAASGSTTITVGTIAAGTERVDPDDDASAWQIACIIPPQEIAASTAFIQVTMADGGVLTYKPDAKCTFTSTKVNTYNMTVHAKELTLTGNPTIDPWTVGDTDQGHEAQPVITL